MTEGTSATGRPAADQSRAAGDLAPVTIVRSLFRQALTATLSTLDARTGGPFGSLVTIATTPEDAPLLLLSQLARHTRNLGRDARASLLITSNGQGSRNDEDPLAAARVTAVGRCVGIEPGSAEDGSARRLFLARHPAAEDYASFADFSMFRLDIEAAYLVAGFGRIVELSPAQLASDGSDGVA